MGYPKGVIVGAVGVHAGEGGCDEWRLGVQKEEASGGCLVDSILNEIRSSVRWAMGKCVQCSSGAGLDRGEEGAMGSVCKNKQFPKDGFKDLCDKATEEVIAEVFV